MGAADTTANEIVPFIAEGRRLSGAFDYVDAGCGLRGWVVDTRMPGNPLSIVATCSGKVLARSVAVINRPDIDKVIGRTTQSGFLIGWSRFDREALSEISRDAPSATVQIFLTESQRVVPTVCAPTTARDVQRMIAGAPVGDRRADFRELNDYLEVETSGLFEQDWYRREYAGQYDDGMPPILDYLRRGEAANARPCLYFNPASYAQAANLTMLSGALLHYFRRTHGSRNLPSVHFDNKWYRETYFVPNNVAALADYLTNRSTNDPNRWFKRADYLASAPPEAAAGDAYEHFTKTGAANGVLPSRAFPSADADARTYLQAVIDDARKWLSAPAPPQKAQSSSPAAQSPTAASEPGSPVKVSPSPVKSDHAAHAPPGVRSTSPSRQREVPRIADIEARIDATAADEIASLQSRAEKNLETDNPTRANAALLLAVIRAKTGDKPGSARAQAAFLEIDADLQADVVAEIRQKFLQMNHELFNAQHAPEVFSVYRLLYARGVHDYLSTLRVLESAIGAKHLKIAAKAVADLETTYASELNAWGLIALCRYYRLSGQSEKAGACALRIPPYPETTSVLAVTVIHAMIENGQIDEAERRIAAFGDEVTADVVGARLRLAVWKEDMDAVVHELKSPEIGKIQDWKLSEAAYLAVKPGVVPTASGRKAEDLLLRRLAERGVHSLPIIKARIHILMQRKRWPHLGELFAELVNTPAGENREVLLSLIEMLCQTDRIQEAETIYDRHFAQAKLGKWEGISVIRMLSELKRWEEAGRVIVRHVEQGFGFGGSSHIIMRAVRKAEVHPAIATLMTSGKVSPTEREAELDDFLALVQEDYTLVQSARALTGNTPSGATAPRFRSNWLLQDSAYGVEDDSMCLFLCTNRRYFLSLLTFLCSSLSQAPQMMGKLFVFLDKDVPKHWYGTVTMVAARFGRAVEIVPENDFVPAQVEHRVQYGFFAGGGGLSRAAYFRLYAARFLMKRAQFVRALYIDTDIVCRGDLSPLLKFDLGDKLIAARIEDYSLDVKNAADRNGIDPRAYFNSGVLVLDFNLPELPALIDEAIRLSEHEAERLVFHDQCALNIAFKGCFQPLPERFNFFLRPHRERNGYIEDGILLHYLDKPKPWDIVFDRSYREEWRVWAIMLGTIIPQGLYIDMFAAANQE